MENVMRLIGLSRIAIPLVVALVGEVASASAATFTYSSYSVVNEQDITILTPNDISGGMGGINLIGSGANTGQDILAWCLDVYTYLNGSGTYQIGPLTLAGSGHGNPELSNTQIGEIGSLIANGDAIINTSHDVSAAIQLAIWEIEYGNSFTYTGVDSGVTNLANMYVANVEAGSWNTPDNNVSLLSESGNQDLAFVTPLPATLPLFAGGLGFVGYLTRRRKQALATA
jgi:hypothetical protein